MEMEDEDKKKTPDVVSIPSSDTTATVASSASGATGVGVTSTGFVFNPAPVNNSTTTGFVYMKATGKVFPVTVVGHNTDGTYQVHVEGYHTEEGQTDEVNMYYSTREEAKQAWKDQMALEGIAIDHIDHDD